MVVPRLRARLTGLALRDLAWQWDLRLGSLAAVAVVWELSTRNLGSLLIPTFTGTVRALVDLLARGALWEPLRVSNEALLLGCRGLFEAEAVRHA
jgi:ABC-type nitrate/sulfonate/bicarbonate transport system permease component